MEITVGVDVSKDRLDVHVHPAGEVFAVSNDDAGVAELCRRLEACKCDAIGLEASGGYERLAVGALAAAGLPVVVLNPMQVRAKGEVARGNIAPLLYLSLGGEVDAKRRVRGP